MRSRLVAELFGIKRLKCDAPVRMEKMQLAKLLIVVFTALLATQVSAIIPIPCATEENLASGVCCPKPEGNFTDPGPCGINLGRGRCAAITNLPYNTNVSADFRKYWPIQFFSSTCVCGERYGGVDCGECSYAYNDGTTECKTKTVLPRKSVSTLSRREWDVYRNALRTIKDNPSRYMVPNGEISASMDMDRQQRASLIMENLVPANTYDVFVWLHHIVAKDNDATVGTPEFTDFAHEGTGFPTWHRLFLLWLEREIQVAIDDHEFRLPFWDWTEPSQREYLFTRSRLGENNNGIVEDDGLLFDDWDTYCWRDPATSDFRAICDLTMPSNERLRRCPRPELCAEDNPNWPSEEDMEEALSIESYDAPPYDRYVRRTSNSFRNFMEGFIVGCDSDSDTLCSGDPLVTRKLHNSVHIMLGIGDVKDVPSFDQQGVMSCVAASPNDPIFINHHANVDCLLEKWLQKNKNKWLRKNEADYPISYNNSIRLGHRKYDYIVPFIPLFAHNEMFKTADNFGYKCSALSTGAQSLAILLSLLAVSFLLI